MWYTWYKKSPRRSGYDRYENFVARNTLSANAGACLSLKGEFGRLQANGRVNRIENEAYRRYPSTHTVRRTVYGGVQEINNCTKCGVCGIFYYMCFDSRLGAVRR